jgi:hypothetical protein
MQSTLSDALYFLVKANICEEWIGKILVIKIKMPPDYGQEATQMFSQRNNPYCDLLLMYYERIF